MAIVLAVLKWRHYLIGRKFLVRSDQSSLNCLLEQRLVSMGIRRGFLKICLCRWHSFQFLVLDVDSIAAEVVWDPKLSEICSGLQGPYFSA